MLRSKLIAPTEIERGCRGGGGGCSRVASGMDATGMMLVCSEPGFNHTIIPIYIYID